MINPLFANLFSDIVENRISKWVEVKEKREKGQVGFRLKHFTVDHRIMLRHIIEKVWGTKKKYYIALLTSKRHLTRSLEISCGIEWKNLKFLCIIKPLSIDFMKR